MNIKKIWVVDDDQAILDVIQTALEQKDFNVEVLHDPDLIYDRVKKNGSPDLMFIDVHMKKHDGRKITKELKKNTTTKNIPVILMTVDIHIEDKAREAQADGYLRKPFGIDTLLGSIQEVKVKN